MFLKQAACVFLGAGFGACLRWLAGVCLAGVSQHLHFGTFAANLCGCFLAGFFSAMFVHKGIVSQEIRLLLITGFLGGLTTFSAFSLELHDLLRAGRHFSALVTFSANLAGSLGMVFLGFYLFERFMR